MAGSKLKRKNYENLFQSTYGKKSSMSKKQAANIVKQVVAPVVVATVPATTTPTPTATASSNNTTNDVNEIKPCRGCDTPIYFQQKTIKNKIAEDQIELKVIKIPTNKSDGQPHKCKYRKCNHCEEYIYFDDNHTRPVKESEKERLKKDTIRIPMNKKDNKRHRCANGPLPRNDTCGRCGGKIFWDKLFYDDAASMFIPLDRNEEEGTMSRHTCRQKIIAMS